MSLAREEYVALLEAECARMRQALESGASAEDYARVQAEAAALRAALEGACRIINNPGAPIAYVSHYGPKINAALATDAGRALLAELEALRQVAQATRETYPLLDDTDPRQDVLRAALVALDKVKS